jgi:1-deoxy-D-xylulose-5-phosphate synthase
VLHALTQKGRGFQPALEKQKKFHGLGPYDPETGETKPAGQKTYSEIFAEGLSKLADKNDKVVAITAAMPNGTALDLFRPHHPKRYFDVGIAEEHAVLFAAGMATMDRGGLSGDDGPTHHGLFDISYLRGIPNIVHMNPKDEDELQDMMQTALEHNGPSAIRYPRGTGPGVTVKDYPVALEVGKAEVLQDGSDVAVFSLGAMVGEGERLAKMLKDEGQSVALINARFAKPVDAECVLKYARRCGAVITMEDHVLAGGFGSVVLETLSAADVETPVVRVGWPDEFIEHGKPEALRAKYGLTAEAAMQRVRGMLKRPVGV